MLFLQANEDEKTFNSNSSGKAGKASASHYSVRISKSKHKKIINLKTYFLIVLLLFIIKNKFLNEL